MFELTVPDLYHQKAELFVVRNRTKDYGLYLSLIELNRVGLPEIALNVLVPPQDRPHENTMPFHDITNFYG